MHEVVTPLMLVFMGMVRAVWLTLRYFIIMLRKSEIDSVGIVVDIASQSVKSHYQPDLPWPRGLGHPDSRGLYNSHRVSLPR